MKNRIMACITASLLVFTGASVWEGAASIAPIGDLPDEGFYAATNSFPRNTVVDITNLETGQSIRVIVAAGLETPGLLAVLSRDAAGMIGIRARSIGRIRMTQPSDPVAFSRFTEGLGSSGDPDYDPRALVSADPLAQTYAQSAAAPEVAGSPGVPADTAGGGFPPVSDSAAAGPGEGETGPWYDEIVDLPDPGELPGASEPDEGIVRERSPEPLSSWAEETVPPEGAPEDETIELADPWERPGEAADPGTPETDSPEISQPPHRDIEPGMPLADEPNVPPAASVTPTPEDYELTLVPAEEQAPEETPRYEIAPELVIDPIPEARILERAAAPEPVMDESQFVDSLGTAPPESAAAISEVPPAPVAAPLPDLFSVPLISSLEQGKYYVQIGAFSRTETVEALINKVGNGYPLAVQNGGTGEKPVYRLLIGPVNLGESGALLQRFRSIGYRDVFVRKGS
jgi:cell division septation protein DedD